TIPRSSLLYDSPLLPILFFFFQSSGDHRDLHSFPTRRSSDLDGEIGRSAPRPSSSLGCRQLGDQVSHLPMVPREGGVLHVDPPVDRKSTRLNSSHVEISYAVFCLKKKKKKSEKQ